jgi:hypothetical protein
MLLSLAKFVSEQYQFGFVVVDTRLEIFLEELNKVNTRVWHVEDQ